MFALCFVSVAKSYRVMVSESRFERTGCHVGSWISIRRVKSITGEYLIYTVLVFEVTEYCTDCSL